MEFFGIAFFSFIVGSINNLFINAAGDIDSIQETLEDVDIFLVKLDMARKSKSLPEKLYTAVTNYIKDSIIYDHSKLIKDSNLLFQLKPRLRYDLVTDLFPTFFKQFRHMFSYHEVESGKEFIALFVSQLYCRVFLDNQVIVKRGDNFPEFYMIFKGRVNLSLKHKDINEYFTLYETTYFGDY